LTRSSRRIEEIHGRIRAQTILPRAPRLRVVNSLAARGVTAVVLGCTEIPLGILAGPADALDVPVIDTIDGLALAAIGWARPTSPA
jgi:aspartate racemase